MDKLPRLTIYLAGHSKELEYRSLVKSYYSNFFNLIDPLEIHIYDLQKMLGDHAHTFIVRRDKKLILQSDILVAYIRQGSTFGTTMEIEFAKSNNIPVYIIDPNSFRDDPWLKYHCDKFFDTIEDCFEHILKGR